MTLYLRPRNLDTQHRLDFIHMGRIIHTVSTTFNLGDNTDVHITLLCEFFLGEFFFATRGSDSVACGFRDILRLFCQIGVVAGAAASAL